MRPNLFFNIEIFCFIKQMHVLMFLSYAIYRDTNHNDLDYLDGSYAFCGPSSGISPFYIYRVYFRFFYLLSLAFDFWCLRSWDLDLSPSWDLDLELEDLWINLRVLSFFFTCATSPQRPAHPASTPKHHFLLIPTFIREK